MNRKKQIITGMIVIGAACFLLVRAASAESQAPTLPWDVIGGGGTGGSEGNIEIRSTLGQPLSGPSTGSDIEQTSGFWVWLEETLFTLFLPILVR